MRPAKFASSNASAIPLALIPAKTNSLLGNLRVANLSIISSILSFVIGFPVAFSSAALSAINAEIPSGVFITIASLAPFSLSFFMICSIEAPLLISA